MMPNYPYKWHTRTQYPERYGAACRIISTAGYSPFCCVEFEDGVRVAVSRNLLKRKR